MVKKALLIGCNYTGTNSALRGCVNDVKSFKRYLLENGYSESQMRVLTDEPTDKEKEEWAKSKKDKKKDKKDKDKHKDKDKDKHKQKEEKMPTRKNILDGIAWLIKDAQPGDFLFFQFSGHGGQIKDTSGDEADGMDEVIFPCDFKTNGCIVDDELYVKLVKAVPEGVTLNAVMDCCHSGTGLDLPYVYDSRNPKLSKQEKEDKKKKDKEKKDKKKDKKDKKDKGKDKDKDKDKDKHKDKDKDKHKDKDKDKDKDKHKDKDKDKDKDKKDKKKDKKGKKTGDSVKGKVVLISGCQDKQTSADTSVGGALTYSVLQTLSKTKGKLTYEELLYQSRDVIRNMGSKIGQIPQLSYNNPDFDIDSPVTI